jgi:penicillin-binding protein 2
MRNRLSPFQGPRLVFFTVVMLSAFLVLVFRLFEWQAIEYKTFQAGADENAIQSVPLPAPRGVIYDRYGVPLALNAPAFNVSVIPANLPDDNDQALAVLNRLSALIDVPATRAAADAAGKTDVRSIQDMVQEGQGIAPYRPVVVKSDIPQAIAQEILEDKQDLPGVDVSSPAAVRQYPSGALTSQIVGYLGPIGAAEAQQLAAEGYNPAFERVGYSGVEAFLDDDLAGARGLLTQVVDVAGLPVRVTKRVEPVAGKNVKLTLDLELQKGAQEALTRQIDHINLSQLGGPSTVTQSGVVIAMNPKTGEILAMVSWPTYDDSQFARSINADYYFRVLGAPFDPLSNHAISSLYPPGSTWKIITAGAAAQEQVVKPDSFLFDPGELFVENSFAKNDPGSRQRFVCWLRAGHGEVDMVHGIAWSCDVYFYQVGGGNPDVSPTTLKPGGLGITDLDRYATMYGIGTKLGIELPGEVSGRMPDPDWKRRNYGESWSTGDTYNAAFGQGYVTVTPLQLVTAISAVANGGTVYQPTIVNSWVDSAGNILTPFKPNVERTVLIPPEGTPAVLNAREDMFIQGKNSLACVCAQDSPFNDSTSDFYDKNMPNCTPDLIKNYTAKTRIDRTKPYASSNDYSDTNPNLTDLQYTVNVPYNYSFRGLCDPRQFQPGYQPPFIDASYLKVVQEGMRGAVTFVGGTVNLVDIQRKGFVDPVQAGKTGTAEYCDDIANKQGLCIPGSWPSHAWFLGYAPYPDPDVAIVAFIYNGGEGSSNALPVVQATMDCYQQLKAQRARSLNGPVDGCKVSMPWETNPVTAP